MKMMIPREYGSHSPPQEFEKSTNVRNTTDQYLSENVNKNKILHHYAGSMSKTSQDCVHNLERESSNNNQKDQDNNISHSLLISKKNPLLQSYDSNSWSADSLNFEQLNIAVAPQSSLSKAAANNHGPSPLLAASDTSIGSSTNTSITSGAVSDPLKSTANSFLNQNSIHSYNNLINNDHAIHNMDDDGSNSIQQNYNQQRQTSSTKRANKWKKNKKKLNEQLQQQYQQNSNQFVKGYGNIRSQNYNDDNLIQKKISKQIQRQVQNTQASSISSQSASSSSWTQQHQVIRSKSQNQNIHSHQWPVHNPNNIGSGSQPISALPTMTGRNTNSNHTKNSWTSSSSYINENYPDDNKNLLGCLPKQNALSPSPSSLNSSPLSMNSFADSRSSLSTTTTHTSVNLNASNSFNSTHDRNQSMLSSSAFSFQPTTRAVAAAVASVPFSNTNIHHDSSNFRADLNKDHDESIQTLRSKNSMNHDTSKSVDSNTSVSDIAKTIVPSSMNNLNSSDARHSSNSTLPATHRTRGDGELLALKRQVEQKQQYEMQKIAREFQQNDKHNNNRYFPSLSSTALHRHPSFDTDASGTSQSTLTASSGITMGNNSHGIQNMHSGAMLPSSYDINSIGEESAFTTNTASIDYSVQTNTTQGPGMDSTTTMSSQQTSKMKKREWLLRMNRRLNETPIGKINPDTLPITAAMNAWAKTKSAEGASMVEMWLKRVKEDKEAGNKDVEITTKMYTMAVDAWAKSGEKGAAKRAESILHDLNQFYQESNRDEALRPTTGIFNAVINAWARSGEKIAPQRAEQIFEWMEKLCARGNFSIKPDKYTFNTVIHAYAKFGGKEAAIKAQQLLNRMHHMHMEGNSSAKPDTITYNVVINCLAKSGGKGAALEAEKLLSTMHMLHDAGDVDVKPNVVTYGAVIDAWAKSKETGAAGRADNILANMIQLHQADPVKNADLRPNTYTFNTVINAWAKSKEHDAASKAEEMLVAMGRLHACGIPGLKPDAFTYTAVIDAWAKSGYRGAAARADQLLDKMEAQFQAGDFDLKPNTFTYNAVINALAKSGEMGAAARAERVLHNMVNRHRQGGINEDVKPTTINFNTVLDAWAKSGGKGAAERAEEILEWMDRLNKSGNPDVKPDTITFNAVIDAWARSGDKRAPTRAEQILDHMDDLYQAGNTDVKPDTYTYNTVINAWAKSGERGSASRAEQILAVMERRYRDGDKSFKPNTRTHTSVIDAWAKSGERGAAARAEHILNTMQSLYDSRKDNDIKPNAHTCNAVMNACAFTKTEEDRMEALEIAFRVFDWLSSRSDMHPDAYTFTILLSVCSNLLPKEDEESRYTYAEALFRKCCDAGHVNHFVLRKLRQTVTEREYTHLLSDGGKRDPFNNSLPLEWTRNVKMTSSRNRKGNNHHNHQHWKSKSNHHHHHHRNNNPGKYK